MKKNILLVDDSALMRRVLSDIISSNGKYQVTDTANNGKEALKLLETNQYDAVVLDVNMPIMNGIQMLREMNRRKIAVRVMMASTDTMEGAQVTLDALDLGALDFVHKPTSAIACRDGSFQEVFLRTLDGVVSSRLPDMSKKLPDKAIMKNDSKVMSLVQKEAAKIKGNHIVAIASSTGGPKALQSVIPKLPKNLKAPVLLVQHMPTGFTKSLAERLNTLSEIEVTEAVEGEVLQNGHVYLAMAGKHMKINCSGAKYTIQYTDEPNREGVKPCANYMYESLKNARKVDCVVCVVMTGMGADGKEGIENLKSSKKTHVISQAKETCTIYGMPKAVEQGGLSDQVVGLEDIAQEIIMHVGVG